ncbi:MAG: hypothetical protein MUE52_05935 [Tabrizicola sp.]|jgi:hypothetical protein|nr:hypothetical protein [Tabrizicola sp.]
MERKELIEAAARRFNVARCDLDYLLAHDGSPGVTELINAEDGYEYFGSLAEHECHLARLEAVNDVDSLIDVCIGLRDCGYDDPSVIERLRAAAYCIGDSNLIDAIEAIEDREALIFAILEDYGAGDVGVMIGLMDGSAIVRVPLRVLQVAA